MVVGVPLIQANALKDAQGRLSAQRVEDTLLAESATDVARLIQRFRKSKSEHNLETLEEVTGLKEDMLARAIRQLIEVGFLEELTSTWRV